MRKINKINKNIKATGMYTIANFFNKASSLLLLPIFTRILTATDYGIVYTYSAWIIIGELVIGMSLGNTLRSAYLDYQDDIGTYISSMYALSILVLLIEVPVLVLANNYFIHLPLLYLVLGIGQSFGTFIIDTSLTKYMMEQRYNARAVLSVIPNIISIVISIFMIINMSDNKYWGRIIPMAFVPMLIGIFILLNSFIKYHKINIYYWKYGLKFSVPLVIHGLSIYILSQSDRTMLTAMRSPLETGIYSVVYNLSLAVTVITQALESVWIPWFTKKYKNYQKEEINHFAKAYIGIAAIFTCGAMLCLPEILKIFTTSEYWKGINLISPIVLASFITFLYSISVDLEYLYKSTLYIAINTCIAAGINLVLNYIFIPKFGAVAAASTTLIAFTISFILHYLHTRKLDSELFPWNIYIIPLILAIVISGTSYILIDHAIIRWAIALVVATLGFSYFYKNYKCYLGMDEN
ncbi:MAG: oligosaccharide flippase family protein [Candidatus Metalachnospira sp.]|nr:oligosaccharide flippase family protein [Candidatus Metalachnospira sp.]